MKITYYHIFNRGAHKAEIFNDGSDYMRMLKLLYIANNSEAFELNSLRQIDIFSILKKDILVNIVAYCLMPNHFHIALKLPDVTHPEKNLTRFMRKLCTGYSNYYNIKYDHSGTIWQGPYKKKEVCDEEYKQILINYIHMNPYGIKNPNVTKGAKIDYLQDSIDFCKTYEYSSYRDYLDIPRPQSAILSPDVTHPGNKKFRTVLPCGGESGRTSSDQNH